MRWSDTGPENACQFRDVILTFSYGVKCQGRYPGRLQEKGCDLLHVWRNGAYSSAVREIPSPSPE